ncbi:KdsC family phosphatase [Sphaerochaeta globosa]|uniref:3-deoxy-D-manno-octulosonate 8-phosphate phosphatase, YrbI family n=1 Tax=Sphaerochaeta globosa (strain ATCC BAA-1886 / DSM 22777 / Buddy) TaxID=158189 RepID=F0RRI6_SPHGB|nr:HAD hydrolase family protein [Sphaerochaeta globosa]ADY14238.1 3-deoxy-D-manno-octulosonate 8-phosphate phosphatase, YrbI family [Sphaerochaeta globosa str. Buddy]
MKQIDMILTDIDGVWTDGGLYFSQTEESMKRFSVYDGWGIRYCRNLNIPVGIITAEDLPMASLIGKKFKTPYIFTAVSDKLETGKTLAEQLNISMERVAYIGDDLNDLPLLRAVGFSGCPTNAPIWVKREVDYVCQTQGGYGAFREFVEHILQDRKDFQHLIEIYAQKGRYVQ